MFVSTSLVTILISPGQTTAMNIVQYIAQYSTVGSTCHTSKRTRQPVKSDMESDLTCVKCRVSDDG